MERRITKTEMMATIRACWLDSGYSNRSQTRLLREMDIRLILYQKKMCTNPDDNNYKYRNLKMEKPLQIICRQSLLLLLDEAFIFPEA